MKTSRKSFEPRNGIWLSESTVHPQNCIHKGDSTSRNNEAFGPTLIALVAKVEQDAEQRYGNDEGHPRGHVNWPENEVIILAYQYRVMHENRSVIKKIKPLSMRNFSYMI